MRASLTLLGMYSRSLQLQLYTWTQTRILAMKALQFHLHIRVCQVSHSQTMTLRSIQQYLQAMQCHVGMVMQQPLWPHLDLMVFFT
ncbi:hypothetical protein AAFF_G00147550 [Aldrovandia affinis]|uniref:Uncharacterized protein n=1 Tax=Aldrovandia affinis TaxID=143900 RepID=A0AAD7RPH7_9TELE|nr:hypothetical protein AAFF_G00147550 [Aldrovandia affinis]